MRRKKVFGPGGALWVAIIVGCGSPAENDQSEVRAPETEVRVPQAETSRLPQLGELPSAASRSSGNGLQRPRQISPRNPDSAQQAVVPRPSRADQATVDTDIRLTDVTDESGISFRHTHGGSGEGYIVEGMASGIAVFDYDGDGLEDIYFLNGAPLKGTPTDTTPTNALYRNNGDWTFTDVTEEAGVGDTGFAMGATAGDYDNDGDLDLYITNFGPNVLYRNDGNRTFTDVSQEANVAGGDTVGAGCSFFDMDADGDLDLYVANYVDFSYENHVPIVIQGHRFQAGPQYYNPIPDSLFRNDGDGTFTDVSEASGISSVAGPGMATICVDIDDDSDTDVFVCNDGEANFLFVNDGTGRFDEQGVLAGLAYDFNGKANSSMGVDCADYDGDGKLDLFVTDYQAEMPVLYHNLGGGLFEDATSSAKIATDLFAHVHWGTGFVDFENDRDQDLFVACGHFDRIELIDDRTALKVPNYLLMNRGQGEYIDISGQAGDGMKVVATSRGAGFADFDNDGDVDVVVLNSDDIPTILRNDSETDHHWLQIQLRSPESNRFGVGARVRVISGTSTQVAPAVSGRGYQSHFGTRLHFGLGDHNTVDSVEVRWPSGHTESFAVPAIDQLVELVEGTGTVER